MLANIENISGAKRKENLTNHAEDARVSKQLATAITDIDIELELDELISRRWIAAGCARSPASSSCRS